MQTQKIFLASSQELKDDRREFEIFVNRKNKSWVEQGVFLELVVWEDFLDALSQTRLQDEYNKAIRDCDIFVMLFCTRVGKYTAEEFEVAFGQFKATNKPLIFTYFKDAQVSLGSVDKDDLMSLWAFKEKLSVLGHFLTVYKSIDELKFQFDQQLDKLAANGAIQLRAARATTADMVPSAALPHLAYGSWTLRNAIDGEGKNDWSNSVLRLTSQQPSPEGLALRGRFTWRLHDELVGTEEIIGHYIAATRQVILEGEQVSDQRLAIGSYFAFLSADERELRDGRWGSTALQDNAGSPGHWEATR